MKTIAILLFLSIQSFSAHAETPPVAPERWIQLNDKLGFIFKKTPKLNTIDVISDNGDGTESRYKMPLPNQSVNGYFVTLIEGEWVYINLTNQTKLFEVKDK